MVSREAEQRECQRPFDQIPSRYWTISVIVCVPVTFAVDAVTAEL